MSQRSNYEGQDRFSNLPNFIISLILSFLPIKDAVRTSVLSTKWKYMWTFITELHFEDRQLYSHNKINKTNFINFVYNVLLHLNASSIRSFSLFLSGNYNPYLINQWISTILIRNVKELSIVSRRKLDISSHSLLQSKFLKKLVLDMNGCAIRVPTFVCLSSLTILKLSKITFTCDHSNDSLKLSLNFPVLTQYEIINCTWSNVNDVTIEVHMLKVLLIRHTSFPKPSESHTIIKYCAPCLRHFSYIGYMLPETTIVLSNTCITSAHMFLWCPGEGTEATTMFLACELLKQFNNNIKCLMFELAEVLPLTNNVIPTFGMLRHLDLQNVTGEILMAFLQNTPFLKTLILQELCHFDEELLNLENVPPCLISNLEVVKFRKLNGVVDELRFIKFVMKHARVLKKTSFTPV